MLMTVRLFSLFGFHAKSATAVALALMLVGSAAHAATSPRLCSDLFASNHETHLVSPEKIDVNSLSENASARSVGASLLTFAKLHGLETRLVEVGPEERRVRRIVVAIDITNKKQVADYLAAFNMRRDLDGAGTRVLSLEFQKEVEGEYVFGMVRTGDKPRTIDGIYRWGKATEEDYTDWFIASPIDPRTQFSGFGHLIGLNPNETTNVQYYLDHPAERGPCKSDNCIAWATGIELGRTAVGVSQEERRVLFNELGVSRSVAHFEIARRLAHAANNRHIAMVAFVNGAEGLKNFKEMKDILPPEPQQPLRDIIRGLSISKDAPVMRAIGKIPDGAKVFFPIAAGASPEGMAALIQQSSEMNKGFDVHVLVNGISEALLAKGVATADNKFRLHALFLGGNLRKIYREGRVNVIPGYLADFARNVADPNQSDFHYDAMVVRVAPKNSQGHYSLGPNNDMILTLLKLRPDIRVIAEVNPNVPDTGGTNYLKENQITAKFESRTALAGPAVLPLSEQEIEIGRTLGALVPSGAVLQLGIGNLFGGLPEGLQEHGRRDLRIFTEMFGDPMKKMIELGMVAKAETGFVYGSQELYRWLDHNDSVKVVPTEYVNDPGLVANTPNFHAVNTALQVNLRGDANATHGADGRRISSPGGQVEFMSGAARSRGGKAIIALRSTAKQGEISSIVLDNYAGSITTPHESVTHVVTEFGVAALVGKSESERALALIRIAHPKFRDELYRQALSRGLIHPVNQ